MDVMKLMENVSIKSVLNYCNVEIKKVSADSRDVEDGTLFVCLEGTNFDGHDHVVEAMEKGAVAVVASREIKGDFPLFLVENTRAALAVIAANFYGNPASKLKIVTVVGTNGKTSTTEILSEIFSVAGHPCAAIGTLGYKVGDSRRLGTLTTPDPLELHKNLASIKDAGVEYVFLEASAHAIYYQKLAGIKANATIFTNITQDHLDFFDSMEEYARTKLSYFSLKNTSLAIVNSDDPYGRRLLKNQRLPIISYGIENPADVFAIDIKEEFSGLSFTINAFDRIEKIVTPLSGRFNVYNIMGAVAAAMYFGVDLSVIAKSLEKMNPVPGRFQVTEIEGRRVVLDFAHTPDGLENLLSSIQSTYGGRIVTVFGCGGDRDRSKRAIMGGIAAKYSDYIILTNDNPRSEDPRAIVEEIRKGIPEGKGYEILLDREKAIRRAFDRTKAGDTIALAGKGHEEYMEIKGQKIPYSDGAVLQKLSR